MHYRGHGYSEQVKERWEVMVVVVVMGKGKGVRGKVMVVMVMEGGGGGVCGRVKSSVGEDTRRRDFD